MKLEDQVCSLELAKKLYDLGFEHESHFWWAESHLTFRVTSTPMNRNWINQKRYAAFTVAELGEILPAVVNGGPIDTFKNGRTGPWYFLYRFEGDKTRHAVDDTPTEADVRAKMLIYRLENKLMDPTWH